jgi:hypothetical protein
MGKHARYISPIMQGERKPAHNFWNELLGSFRSRQSANNLLATTPPVEVRLNDNALDNRRVH